MTIKVLLAEDDEELSDRYNSELEKSGFCVVRTSKGSDIEKMISEFNPQIIISDTNLEEMDGDVACRSLFEQGKINDMLIIAMSAMIENGEKWEKLCHEFRWKYGISNLGTLTFCIYEAFKQNPNMLRYKVFPKNSP